MRITTSCLLFAALVAASARAQSWRPAPEPVTLLPTTILTVPSPVVVRAAGQLSDPRTALPAPRLVAGDKTETPFAGAFPIDLPTALRLGNASSPTIAIALARVREALARVDQADALKLPTLSAGGIYLRHDGLDQNRRAELFRVSRQSVFAGGGA
ncbi:MAG TPA: hypothetical protein VKE40_18130, partial [Gemmataceae bacterium]|nr:hypothetical protein [Gemmataceae bacterium]